MMTLNPSPSENVVCLGGLRDPSQHLRDKEPPTVACMLFVSFGYMHLIFPDLLFSKFTSIGVTLHMKLTLWQKKNSTYFDLHKSTWRFYSRYKIVCFD